MALRGTMIVLGALFVLGTSAIAASAPESGPDPGNFVSRVDNPWFPLVPGTTFVYRGVKDGKSARDVFTVAHATKTIQGVRCTAVEDRLGNVWYFGESTAELDRAGRVTSTEGSWQAGRDGAQAGIYMTARPTLGQSRRQEYYKGHAEDHFSILSLRARVSVPFITSSRAVLTKEWTPLEPGTLDHKYYVRGIGQVKEMTVKGPLERSELVSVQRP